jgi:hypothetical protein
MPEEKSELKNVFISDNIFQEKEEAMKRIIIRRNVLFWGALFLITITTAA